MSQKIEIHPYMFNPCYWHIVSALKDPNIRHIYIYGGSSAAKTYSIAQALLIEGERNNFSSVVFRKEQASIMDTIYNDFKEINDNFHLGHNMLQFLIKLVNGPLIRFRGLDKSGKVKGLKGYKKIFLDELDHFKFDDLKELRRRLRGEDNQQIIYAWNPVSKEHWIKTKVLDLEEWIEVSKEVDEFKEFYSELSPTSNKWINKRGDSILIKTNFNDNFWIVGHPEEGYGRIDKHALVEFDNMHKLDPDDYNIYALGEWGTPKVKSPYITAFEKDKHISERAIFDPKKTIYLSFDFNVDNMAVVFSHIGEKYIHFFDEIGGSDLPTVLKKIQFKYGDHIAKFIVTGDRSGNNRTHMMSDGMNSYRLIKNTLGLSTRQIKVIVNPPHKENRTTCNTILMFHPEVLFNPRCKLTIYDLINVECDQDSKIIKKDREVANQKADFLDAFRYTINTFKRKWVKNFKPKKK